MRFHLFPQNSEETSQITTGWIPTNDFDTLDFFYEKGKFTPHGPEKHLLSTQGKINGGPLVKEIPIGKHNFLGAISFGDGK